MISVKTIVVIGICLVAGSFVAGYRVRALIAAEVAATTGKATAEQMTIAVQGAREEEHRQANAFASIDTKFQGDMRYAQALSASTVAGLRDGSIRLSPTWRCPAQRASAVSGAAADTGAAEDADRLRKESAGRVVGYVRQCQAERDYAIRLLEAERQ
jgi:hypothetical protein